MTAAERRAATIAGLVTLTLFTAPWIIGEARGIPAGASKEPPPCVWSIGYPVAGPSMSVRAAVRCPGATAVHVDLSLLRAGEPVAAIYLGGYRGASGSARWACSRGGRYVRFRGRAFVQAFYPLGLRRFATHLGPVMNWRCR